MSIVTLPNRAPYGREAKYAPPEVADDRITTYYDQPQLKKSHWGVRVALYIFIAGLSGGAQLIATAADLASGDQQIGVVQRGRHIALVAVVLGPPLLIWDLHTPQRFYNMLRIFRRTSPMSIGTYVLSSFSLFSIMTAAADLFGWRRVARVAQVPAAIAGSGMTTYTAALLAATSTPIWAAVPRALAIQFAASSLGAGSAALQLAGRADGDEKSAPALQALSAVAAATELVGAIAAERTYRDVGIASSTTSRQPWGALHQFAAIGVGAALPLAAYAGKLASGRPLASLMFAAAIAVLAGSFALRLSVIGAGNDSALHPRQSLRFARRENIR